MEWIYFVKISGLGICEGAAAPSDFLFRFSTLPLASDSSGVYIPCLEAFPAENALEVSFLNGEVELGTQEFQLKATDNELINGYTLLEILLKYNLKKIADLDSPLSAGSTNLVATEETLEGKTIYIGLECIKVGNHVGSGLYTGCLRGCNDTLAADHFTDLEIFDFLHSASDRKITLGRVPANGTYSDEIELWGGALVEITNAEDFTEIITLKTESLQALIEGQKLFRNQWRAKVQAAQFLPNSGGYSTFISALGSTSAAQGKPKASNAESPRIAAYVDGIGAFVFYANHIPNYENSQTLSLVWNAASEATDSAFRIGQPKLDQLSSAVNKDVWEILLVGDLQPSGEGLPLPSNPIALARLILSGNIADLTCNIQENHLDAESWNLLEAYFDGYSVGNLIIGLEGKPFSAWDFITKTLFRPIQVVLTMIQGKLGVARFSNAANIFSAPRIEQENIFDIPKITRNLVAAFDSINTQITPSLGAEPQTVLSVGNFQRQRNIYGRRQSLDLDASAYKQEGGLGVELGVSWVENFNAAFPIVEFISDGETELYPGLVFLITHPSMVNASGTLGTEALACLCLSATYIYSEENKDGCLSVVASVVGHLVDRQGYISPSCKVTDYDGINFKVEVEMFYYTEEGQGPLNNDLEGLEIGYLLDGCDSDLERIGANLGVGIVGIELGQDLAGANPNKALIEIADSFLGVFTAGDILILSDHVLQSTEVQFLWAWQAGLDGVLDNNPALTEFSAGNEYNS